MVEFKLRGLVPPVFTPFNRDYSLNLSVIPQYVRHLKLKGVAGVLVNGTTGEGVSMSLEERMKTAEEWVKAARPEGIHVMVQVGGASLPDVQKLARHAESIKADSILTLPELFFKPGTVEQLVDYLEAVGSSAPNTPLLYYHFPAMTHVHVSMELMVVEAQKRVKTFRGLKLTTPNLEEVSAVLKVCHGDTTPFLGCDTLLLGACAMGIESSIGTTFNMCYDLATIIVDGTKQGLLTGVSQKQSRLTEIVKIITKDGAWVPTMKAAMEILTNINVGPVRPPNKNLTDAQKLEMKRALSLVTPFETN